MGLTIKVYRILRKSNEVENFFQILLIVDKSTWTLIIQTISMRKLPYAVLTPVSGKGFVAIVNV